MRLAFCGSHFFCMILGFVSLVKCEIKLNCLILFSPICSKIAQKGLICAIFEAAISIFNTFAVDYDGVVCSVTIKELNY